MITIVKVFDIGERVEENQIGKEQVNNILNIFDELTKETHLITNCYLDEEVHEHTNSPIYYFSCCNNKEGFKYKRIADDLLTAECKVDGTRNNTIREGLLFIKAGNNSITIMKLEKMTVIDKETYEFKSELGKEKDYFKVCIYNGSFDDIKVIDKNRTASKYWYQKFLGLTRQRTSETNTKEVIKLLTNDELFQKEINNTENYGELKRFTEYYLFDNKKFDKSDLFHELINSGLIELQKEDELFSEQSKEIDSDFEVSEKAVNEKYQKTIRTSDEITIKTKNYLESIRDNQLAFDCSNKQIIVYIDDKFLESVSKELQSD